MRILLISLLCLFSSLSFALPEKTWYQMSQFHCRLSNGTKISYDRSQDLNHVLSFLGIFRKSLYLDSTSYDPEMNLSMIEFSGHRPSAGPSFDPWESAYSIRFADEFPVGVSLNRKGRIFRNRAYTGWIQMPGFADCTLQVESTF